MKSSSFEELCAKEIVVVVMKWQTSFYMKLFILSGNNLPWKTTLKHGWKWHKSYHIFNINKTQPNTRPYLQYQPNTRLVSAQHQTIPLISTLLLDSALPMVFSRRHVNFPECLDDVCNTSSFATSPSCSIRIRGDATSGLSLLQNTKNITIYI